MTKQEIQNRNSITRFIGKTFKIGDKVIIKKGFKSGMPKILKKVPFLTIKSINRGDSFCRKVNKEIGLVNEYMADFVENVKSKFSPYEYDNFNLEFFQKI